MSGASGIRSKLLEFGSLFCLRAAMLKNFAHVLLIGALLVCATACNRDAGKAGTTGDGPDQAILTSARLARDSDMLEHVLPPADFERVKAEWNQRKQDVAVDAEDDARFAAAMAKLTAPGAVDAIYAEIEPDLKQFDAQYKQQMPTIVAMGQGYVQGLVQQNPRLSPAEKEQATAAIGAIAAWVQKTPFTDPGKVRQAIGHLADTARALDLKTLEQGRALSFEQSAPKLKVAIDGLKKVLDVYGFSIDRTLDSVKATVLSNDGNNARVQVTYTVLDTPLTTETDMVKVDGRWYGKDTIEKLKQRAAQPDAPVTAPAGEPAKAGG